MAKHEIETKNLVSIIIPVFNASKTIGKALNSVMGQTYDNVEAIIVDDGSTDGTIDVCKRYQTIDKRLKIYSIKNHGVSYARNFGISKAKGDFLMFLDSDDTISVDAIEQMVKYAVETEKDLVIVDMLSVDMDTNIVLADFNCYRYFKKAPVILDRKTFRAELMQIIFYTILMEGLCGKLYSSKLWKDNKIKLKENISLGEDFLANLEYYKLCNGAVFVGKTCYYYNNVKESSSLTHKYREDLFENKMLLVHELKKHLAPFAKRSDEEKQSYYNYSAAYGLSSIKDVVTRSNRQINKGQKIEIITKIIEDGDFIESFKRASFYDECYLPWKKAILAGKAKKILETPLFDRKKIEEKRSLKNKIARKVVSCFGARGAMLEKCIYEQGIKNTIKQHMKGKI